MLTNTTANQTFDIPYIDLAGQHRVLKRELLDAMSKVLDHGKFILGPEVEKLETKFAEMCQAPYAVALNSGTDALILALKSLGIGSGDEVITAPNSFIATTSAIVLVGARPVFVDVANDYNIDPELIEKAITKKTKAILPVHLTGRAAQMDKILSLAEKYNLHVIEDAAQAVLAEYRSRRVGSFGTVGCFSLHPLKTFNACGDGGMITTRDEKIYNQIKILRNLGLVNRHSCNVWSGNSRLDTIQAAVLLVKLKYVVEWTEKRRANAAYYRDLLAAVSEIQVPEEKSIERNVYHTFVVQAKRRDQLKKYLEEQGIETAIHYPIPIHLQQSAQSLGYAIGSFPNSEEQARHILSLPVYPELTLEKIKRVCSSIKNFYAHSSN